MTGIARSQVLIRWKSTAAGNGPVFQCAAGYVVLVKSLYAWAPAAPGGELHLYVATSDQAETVAISKLEISADAPLNWQGWFAMNPGDIMFPSANAAGIAMWVSGAVLAGPNQFPPASLLAGALPA